MSTVHKKLLDVFQAEQAYGYETSYKIQELKLRKTHSNDAFVIAGGTEQSRNQPLMLEEI